VKHPQRQPEESLPPDILRIVEGIALALAQEHHAMENDEKTVFRAGRPGFDRRGRRQQER
jgi:hypothetical protein